MLSAQATDVKSNRYIMRSNVSTIKRVNRFVSGVYFLLYPELKVIKVGMTSHVRKLDAYHNYPYELRVAVIPGSREDVNRFAYEYRHLHVKPSRSSNAYYIVDDVLSKRIKKWIAESSFDWDTSTPPPENTELF